MIRPQIFGCQSAMLTYSDLVQVTQKIFRNLADDEKINWIYKTLVP